MNKRTLKKQAKKAEQELLERSADFYNALIKNNYEKKTKKSRTPKIIAITSTAFTAILTLVLCLVFLLPDSAEPPKKHYLIQNEQIEVITINEFAIINIDFNLSADYQYTIYHAYDTEYNDILYYKIVIANEDTFEAIVIYFYTNLDYENRKELDYESGTSIINDLPTIYCKKTHEDDGIFTVNYSSITELDNLMIYIEYEQWTFDEESNFFNFFEQTIEKA